MGRGALASPAIPDPVSLLFRHVLDERRRALFPPGLRVLEVKGGEVAPAAADGPLDAAWAGPGALDGAPLASLGRRLALALRPGSPVLLCVGNARPLPVLLARALTGQGRRPPASPSLREVREALGPAFEWRRASALGVFLPAPGEAAWAAANPQLFGLLAAAERLVRDWPVLRGLGTLAVLEGVRR
jgi:hypothetical protein